MKPATITHGDLIIQIAGLNVATGTVHLKIQFREKATNRLLNVQDETIRQGNVSLDIGKEVSIANVRFVINTKEKQSGNSGNPPSGTA